MLKLNSKPIHTSNGHKAVNMYVAYSRGSSGLELTAPLKVRPYGTTSIIIHAGGDHFVTMCLCGYVFMCVWRFGVAVTRWSRSTQLLYIEPG